MSRPHENLNRGFEPLTRWYCRRSNQTIGPVTTEEIVAFIERRTLADYDEVRLDGTDDWQKVQEIRRLLLEPPPQIPEPQFATIEQINPDGEQNHELLGIQNKPISAVVEPVSEGDEAYHDAAHAASEVLSHMNASHLRRRARGVVPQPRRRPSGKSLSVAIIDGTSTVLTWLLVQISRGLQLRSLQAASALILIAAVVWGVVLPRWPIDSPELLAEFDSLAKRIEAQCEVDATEVEWQHLKDDVTSTVRHSLDRLNREASSRRPDLQELLAAAELLPAAVKEGQTVEGAPRLAMSKLTIHLDNAQRHIERREELSADALRRSVSNYSVDGMFWGIVVVDVFVVVALLVWAVRALIRRAGAAQRPTVA